MKLRKFLSDENVIFMDFFAVKVDGGDVKVTSTQESVYMKTSLQIPGLTSFPSTLTAKRSMKMTFSSDKIYYNFSQ